MAPRIKQQESDRRGDSPADFVNFVNAEVKISTDQGLQRGALNYLDGSSVRPDRSRKGKGSYNCKMSGEKRISHHSFNHVTEVTAGSLNPTSLYQES